MSTQWQTARPRRPRRPPLSKRLRPRHWMALDFLAAVLCVPVLFLSISRGVFLDGARLGSLLLSGLLALALSAPIALRRRAPLAALVWSIAGAAAVAVFAWGELTPSQTLVGIPAFLLPAAYVLHLVAAQYRRRTAVIALASVLTPLVAAGLAISLGPGNSPGVALFTGLVVIIVWGAGYAAGQRRAYASQLQEQAASGAVTEERLRIARELHDVVAHSMTVVAVQAGYGLHVIEGQPVKAQEALGAIQATSREALADMRRMLGVLRHGSGPPFIINNGADGHGASHGQQAAASAGPAVNGAAVKGNGQARAPGEAGAGRLAGIGGLRFRAAAVKRDAEAAGALGGAAAPLAPAPGLADLERLAARIANAGVRVDLRIDGARRELPPGIDLAAFRIVQEALTNVVKHANVAACGVTVGYQEDELTVEITDEGDGGQLPATSGGQAAGLSGEGGGHGLIGMRERVAMYGGELSAGPRPDRGFRVAARLPISGEAL